MLAPARQLVPWVLLVSAELCGIALVAGGCKPAEDEDLDDTSSNGGSAASAGTGGSAMPEQPRGSEAAGTGGAQPSADAPVFSARGSELGAGCAVKNDCANDLSCIRGVCQPARFPIRATGKECYVTECREDTDCCGNLPAEALETCRTRAAKCLQNLPGCAARECSRSSDCAGGGHCLGRCSVTSGQCGASADCLDNRCVNGSCVLDFTVCTADAECSTNTCVGGTCDCSNPSYQPADPVCKDEDCEDICLYACEESRCVLSTDCTDGEECFGSTPLCDEGKCVECRRSTDCSFDKTCLDGRCETPCENDTNCPVFEACQTGECLYVGCRSDRECMLIPSVELAGLPAGTDPRSLRCHTEDGVGRCIVPCQTDAQCPYSEICSGGVCEYIGCELDSECKTIVGLHEQQSSEESPWVSSLECREAPRAE